MNNTMGDYINYGSQQNIKNSSVRKEITYEDNKQTDSEKVTEINSDDAIDLESAYEDSFDSDESDEESETKNAEQITSYDVPLFRFKNSGTSNQNVIASSHEINLTSKVSQHTRLTLEDKISSLSLNEVRPIRSAVIHSHRKNMSFSNNEIMKIERDNEILLRKIMAQQKTRKGKVQVTPQKLSSSAINRKKSQKKIEEDNMMLLQRLQKAKSCALNTNKVPGFRVTHL